MRIPLLFCAGASVIGLSGCQAVQRLLPQDNKSYSRSAQSGQTYLAGLPPFADTRGLAVFDPICGAKTENSACEWSAGMARWINFHAAGQPVFGKTPLWGTYRNLEQPLGIQGARLEGAKAREAAKYLGVSHFVTSQILPDGSGVWRVRWTLSPLSKGAAQTFQSRGTPTQIAAQLPVIAAQIMKASAQETVSLPVSKLSPADFALLGRYPHKLKYEETIAPTDAKNLRAMQNKDALAALVAGRIAFKGDNNADAYFHNAQILVKAAPQNALAWSDIAIGGAARLAPHAASLQKLAAQFPQNALLATTENFFEQSQNNGPAAVQHAERAVRASADSSLMWVLLADAHGTHAGGIRQGRYANNVSRAEWKKLDVIYGNGYHSAAQATRIAPKDAMAWARLAESATFVDTDAGLSALDQALALDSNNSEALSWGMQLTQTKWTGDMERYIAFANDAAARADKFDFDGFDVFHVLHEANRTTEMVQIFEKAHKVAPKNDSVCAELAQWYHRHDHNYAKARPLYQAALKTNPKNGRGLTGLADLTYFIDANKVEAERLYRLAYKLQPDGYNAANLARFLTLTGRKAEGVKLANQAKALGYSDQNHPVWSVTGVSP